MYEHRQRPQPRDGYGSRPTPTLGSRHGERADPWWAWQRGWGWSLLQPPCSLWQRLGAAAAPGCCPSVGQVQLLIVGVVLAWLLHPGPLTVVVMGMDRRS